MVKKTTRTKADDAAAIFKLLGDGNRYRVVAALLKQPKGMIVGDIAELLDVSHSAASHLLSVLHESGVVAYKKEGRDVRYMLSTTPKSRAIARVLKSL